MQPKTLRILLIILDSLLGLAAILGGVGLLTGAAAPPIQQLEGSLFDDYTIPALILMAVGGQSLLAAYWMVRQHPHAALDSLVAGGLAVGYALLAVLSVGFPAGLAGGLLVLYAGLGALIFALATVFRRANRKSGGKAGLRKRK